MNKLQREIDGRLRGAVDRSGMGSDRARVALSLVPLFAAEVEKIVVDAVRESRR